MAAPGPGPIRVGTDFSGLDTVLLSLKHLGVAFVHLFSCDIAEDCRRLIQCQHAPKFLYTDIALRPVDEAPSVDLFCFGPPCQGHSQAGNRLGLEDPRSQLFLHSLEYVCKHRPPAVLFENVPAVVGSHSEVMESILQVLTNLGYRCNANIVDSRACGTPQARQRCYLLAALGGETPSFPAALPPKSLRDFLPRWSRIHDPAFQILPTAAQHRKRVLQAYEKCLEDGINPMTTPVCVDCGVSNARSGHHYRVDYVMTLTRSRCGSFLHWLSTKGDYLDEDDYTLLQGLRAGLRASNF